MNPTWKKRALQTSMLALLTTVAIGAVSASAAETSTTKPVKSFQMVKAGSASATVAAPAFHIGSTFGGLLNNPAVERNYLKLLVTTYSPDSLADWQKALEDRKQAEAEMPKPTLAKRFSLKDGEQLKIDGAVPADTMFFSADGSAKPIEGNAPAGTMFFSAVGSTESVKGLPPLAELKELPELPEAAEGMVMPKRIMIQRSAPDEVQKSGNRVLPVEPGAAGGIIIGEPVQPESIKLQQKLVEAIEADNAESIRAALADYLKEYVKQSEQIKKFAKEIKEKLPTETESESK